MSEKKTERWFFRCVNGCRKSWAAELEIKTEYAGYGRWHRDADAGYYARTAACPHCGHVPQEHPRIRGYMLPHKIMGKVHRGRLVDVRYAPPCDGRCTNAQGPSCDCQCGGANHGSGRLVEVITKAKPEKIDDDNQKSLF